MDTINERIKELISALGIKKTVFAKHLNVSQAFVSQICSGASQPSDRTISDICREFDVSEEWLRTGEGEMFRKKNRNEELFEFASKVVESPSSDIKVKLLHVMARLTDDQWDLLTKIAEEFEKEKTDQV